MNIDDIVEGTHVMIGPDISTTHSRFDSCDTMHRMKGECHRVVNVNRISRKVRVGRFFWDPGDLIEIKDEKPEVIFHYNPDNI